MDVLYSVCRWHKKNLWLEAIGAVGGGTCIVTDMYIQISGTYVHHVNRGIYSYVYNVYEGSWWTLPSHVKSDSWTGLLLGMEMEISKHLIDDGSWCLRKRKKRAATLDYLLPARRGAPDQLVQMCTQCSSVRWVRWFRCCKHRNHVDGCAGRHANSITNLHSWARVRRQMILRSVSYTLNVSI